MKTNILIIVMILICLYSCKNSPETTEIKFQVDFITNNCSSTISHLSIETLSNANDLQVFSVPSNAYFPYTWNCTITTYGGSTVSCTGIYFADSGGDCDNTVLIKTYKNGELWLQSTSQRVVSAGNTNTVYISQIVP